MRPLRVCVDARLPGGGSAGGVEQFILGLAGGLSRLTEGPERYLFLVRPGADGWIAQHLRGPCEPLALDPVEAKPRSVRRLAYRLLPFLDPHSDLRPAAGPGLARVPRSLGAIEAAGVDLVHFTLQGAFLTDLPSIYHPHDLQHLHLPQFFAPGDRARREVRYRAFCARARMVAVASSWTRRDIVRQYSLPEEKVRVVPLAPLPEALPVPNQGDLAAARLKFALPEAFALYPAATWPHKNHLMLLQALASLRDAGGPAIPAVCPGSQTGFFGEIRRKAEELRLGPLVRFPGYVSALELQCLYRLCRCVVIPTRFEAGSFPLWEAFHAGAPAACSNVTSLPEQAGDAALLFDPGDPQAIAAALRSLWSDAALRETLAQRGLLRVRRFSWDRTARTFRAHYRRIAGRPLDDEDRALLEAPPLF